MRLIVVSNRVACPKGDEPIDGGLAAALLPAVKTSGAMWVGSSGRLSDPGDKESFVKVQALGNGAVATVDQPRAHYRKFYEGFANSALWPVLHSRTDLIRTNIEHYASYREINALMARAVLRFARPDAMFWIHDYHYFTLGSELRRLGIEQPIGFFLHTPFPNRNIMLSLPHHRDLMRLPDRGGCGEFRRLPAAGARAARQGCVHHPAGVHPARHVPDRHRRRELRRARGEIGGGSGDLAAALEPAGRPDGHRGRSG